MTTVQVSREFLIEHLAHNAYGTYVFDEQFDGDFDHEDDAYTEACNQLDELTDEELVDYLLGNHDPDTLAQDLAENGKADESGTDAYGGTPTITITFNSVEP